MGGNGSLLSGKLDNDETREYRTVMQLSKNIVVIELKGKHGTMPTESHTANRIYVTMKKDGSGVREVAKFGKDHLKVWDLHTHIHKGMTEGHIHFWKNGSPVGDPEDINDHPKIKELLNKINSMLI